jgi:GNAT superfamily N-acetyltransferase
MIDFSTLNEWKANSGNRRIAGWTALYFPWVDRPLKEEELAIVNSHDMPPGIEGMNMEALQTFFERLSLADKHGYDPKTDYRKKSSLQSPRKPVSNIWADRKGTMVHPDFQRRGFGTFLTHHCNAIADKTGGKTWVPARPSSVKMFRQCGFKDVATHNADLKRFGGNTDEEITWLLVRETH